MSHLESEYNALDKLYPIPTVATANSSGCDPSYGNQVLANWLCGRRKRLYRGGKIYPPMQQLIPNQHTMTTLTHFTNKPRSRHKHVVRNCPPEPANFLGTKGKIERKLNLAILLISPVVAEQYFLLRTSKGPPYRSRRMNGENVR